MPKPKEYTPIVAPRGRIVHATSVLTPRRTACGKRCLGWRVALRVLGCFDCKAAVFYRVKRRRRR